MKMDRLVGILTLLLQQGKTTAPVLAKRFEVSRRTINRDIETLCRAGIPIVTTQGFDGGISIAKGYRLDTLFFTTEELQTLLAGVKGICSISKAPGQSSILEKISCWRLPDEEIVLIDLAAFGQKDLACKIEIIRKAIQNRHLLSFRYYYQKGDCRRTIEPYRLVFRWSSWYVLGYCQDRKGFRLFKLCRLWEPESGPSFLARDIPLQEVLFDRYFDTAPFRLEAMFSAQDEYRLVEEYEPSCYSRTKDGLFFARCFTSYGNMREWVQSFGDRVEVLSPEQLRMDLRQQAENILKKYSKV